MDRKLSRDLIAQLNRDAERIASHFALGYRCIEAERANVTRRYGICYSDGTIRVRVRHAVSGRPLKYSSLVNTLCHELAHLKHFNHGLRFREFYRRLLEWARAEGIYRPSSGEPAREDPEVAPPRPVPTMAAKTESGLVGEQLSLFG